MNSTSPNLPDISQMSLYYFNSCPYCVLVLDALNELKLDIIAYLKKRVSQYS